VEGVQNLREGAMINSSGGSTEMKK